MCYCASRKRRTANSCCDVVSRSVRVSERAIGGSSGGASVASRTFVIAYFNLFACSFQFVRFIGSAARRSRGIGVPRFPCLSHVSRRLRMLEDTHIDFRSVIDNSRFVRLIRTSSARFVVVVLGWLFCSLARPARKKVNGHNSESGYWRQISRRRIT